MYQIRQPVPELRPDVVRAELMGVPEDLRDSDWSFRGYDDSDPYLTTLLLLLGNDLGVGGPAHSTWDLLVGLGC